MANVTGLLTLNLRAIYEVDADPSAAATPAPISTIALRSDTGQAWLKTGSGDTAWSQIATLPVSLTSMVTGVLPIANGGTNSSTALVNNRVMVSSGGKIVESSALADGQILIGSTAGAPVVANITAGIGISVTNASGSITIATTSGDNELYPTVGTLLNVNYTAGTVAVNGTYYSITAGSVAVGASVTNGWVYVNTSGVVTAGATLPTTAGIVPIAQFTSGTTAVTTVSDRRTFIESQSVYSVGLSMPGIFTVSSSPVTSSGTLTAVLATQSANTIFAGPASGSAVAPTFRTQVLADLPQLANGQLYIGSTGLSVVAATLTQGANNGVTIVNAAGSITLSTVQDIRTTASPSFTGLTVSGLTASSPVLTNGSSALTTGNINLTSMVTGVLPIANGGTNSSTALVNNQIMVSSSGKIVEAGAMLDGQLLIGYTGSAPVIATLTQGTNNGVTIVNGHGTITLSTVQDIRTSASPTFTGLTLSSFTQGSVIFAGASGALAQDNTNFFYDSTNHYLGIKVAAPTRTLDVGGSSLFRAAVRIASSVATTANYEIFQAQVATTDNTVTPLATIATTSDSAMLLEIRVVARRTNGTGGTVDNAATYIRTLRVKNVAGTVTIPTNQSTFTSEDENNWNVTFTISTTNVVANVIGATGDNISWAATYMIQTI